LLSLASETLTEQAPDAAVIWTAPVDEFTEQAVELTAEYEIVPVRLAILPVPRERFVVYEVAAELAYLTVEDPVTVIVNVRLALPKAIV
jgi:hypothetical protein